jgi:hypothetical protein
MERTTATQELVVHHLAGQTTLEIKDHWDAQKPSDKETDKRTFVHMRMEHGRAAPQSLEQHRPEEE